MTLSDQFTEESSAPDVSLLFEAGAFRVAPPNEPFWFTSGLIGPYFISTHYLCGGPERAEALLSFIDTEAEKARTFPGRLLAELHKIYETDPIYKAAVDHLAALAAEVLPISEVTHVSGGQRRDWFFSPLLAEKLEKPCLYLYNDLAVASDEGEEVSDLSEAKVVNVADLLTIGSSYVKKWIPAIEKLDGKLLWSLNVVDRAQGGAEELAKAGVLTSAGLFVVSNELFDQALERNLINSDQHKMLLDYVANPEESMGLFLKKHPDFVARALESTDAKIRARAELMVQANPYGLNL